MTVINIEMRHSFRDSHPILLIKRDVNTRDPRFSTLKALFNLLPLLAALKDSGTSTRQEMR